ncbi:Hypothetical Protein FCC1311_071222 [Hondaea fermentalgiana]|uniref:Uncharacterized protein n=1 Tax=Hondaea fermentalgiana TaxID=2315210 RepID=A0A2R5GRC5_9STRA|nr:Hypothetical Protein FCC1311_071222 [Hondaea fermentalgiana]|eukprot:GBG30901.1 Hypothetical Protein FCC1311_071222 [Hondaea fermentalgiana]
MASISPPTSPRRVRARSGSVSVIEAVGEIFADYATGKNTPLRKSQQVAGKHNSSRGAADLDDDDIEDEEEKETRDARQIADAHATLSACQTAATKAELARIYELWQHAKRELRERTEEIASLRASFGRNEVEARLSRLSMAENEELLRDVSVLRERLRTNTQELQAARAENERWAANYEKLSSELRAIRGAQDDARHRASTLEAHATELERENRELECHNEELQRRVDENSSARGKLSAASQDRLAALETKAQALALDLQRAEDARQAAQAALENQTLLVQERDVEIARLHRKIEAQTQELKGGAHKAALDQQRDAQARIDHLRVDNARLLALLRNTPAFKQFMSLCEVTDDANLSYLPSESVRDLPDHHALHPSSHAKNSAAVDARGSATLAWGPEQRRELRQLDKSYASLLAGDRVPSSDAAAELEHWVPAEAVRIMIAFRNRYLPHVAIDLVDHLLRDLGKVWHAHHAKLLKRQKDRHQRHLQDVKRRVQHQTSYEEVMNRNRVGRRDASHKGGGLFNTTREAPSAASGSSLAACLREIDQLTNQLDQLRQENDELEQQVALARKAASPRRGSTGVLVLQPEIRDEFEGLLYKMDTRMRDCMKRVASLHATHAGDPDLLHLVDRAHAAMMEDIEGILSDLQELLGK